MDWLPFTVHFSYITFLKISYRILQIITKFQTGTSAVGKLIQKEAALGSLYTVAPEVTLSTTDFQVT